MVSADKQGLPGLSDEAKAKLEQFIKAYDPINNKVLRQKGDNNASKRGRRGRRGRRDRRLPIPGAVISKIYKGNIINIRVLDKGFEYDGKVYRTLSAVAGAITGQHWNGFLFFGL